MRSSLQALEEHDGEIDAVKERERERWNEANVLQKSVECDQLE